MRFDPFQNNQNKLFGQTRWRLTTWYVSIMGTILIVCGFGVYRALIYAHRLTITKELETVANNFEESLEPILEQPGKLAREAQVILPDLCFVGNECEFTTKEQKKTNFQSRAYYMRLLTPDGNLVATSGKQPQQALWTRLQDKWQQFTDIDNNCYQQVSMKLQNRDAQLWGYLQVGSSLPEYELYVTYSRSILFIGLPTVIAMLILMSWWQAGQAMQPIYQSYQLLQQFTADAAHELGTPLASIMATVESTLMMPEITEIEAKAALQTIGRQHGRLSKLLADLLMLCHMDRHLNVIHSDWIATERVSLANLIEDIAEDFASLSLKSKIKLVNHILVPENLTITGNYEQLYRLMSNLVANAIQYSPEESEIRLILARRNKSALLKVQDRGLGIASEDLKQIFNRFYRVNRDRSRSTGGSGLGLSIAQAIAQAHHGTIEVESELGQGSTFTVVLPINDL